MNNEQFDDDRSEEEREGINLVVMTTAEIRWLLIYMNEVGRIEFVGGTGVSQKSHSLIIDLHWIKFFCFKIFILI